MGATGGHGLAPVGGLGVAEFVQMLDGGLHGGGSADQHMAHGFGLRGGFFCRSGSGRGCALRGKDKHRGSGFSRV